MLPDNNLLIFKMVKIQKYYGFCKCQVEKEVLAVVRNGRF